MFILFVFLLVSFVILITCNNKDQNSDAKILIYLSNYLVIEKNSNFNELTSYGKILFIFC